MDRKKWLILLTVLGIIVAGYLSYIYYTDSHGVCDINDTFKCSDVHASKFALLYGIPVAIIGLVGYFLILIFTFLRIDYVKYISFIGMIFSLRLTWAEFFIIEKFCIFCLISQVLIILIFIISMNWKKNISI